MTVHLTKHHGLGNDFLVALNPIELVGAADAVSWCRRHRGIGADGLIVATAGGDGTWTMVLYNADGSRAELSGNGLRCLGQAIAMANCANEPFAVTVHTDAGPRCLDVEPGTPDATVAVDMGRPGSGPSPSLRWTQVGLEPLRQLGVDMGNPHLVALVDDLDGIDIAEVGPVIEADYASGCNVHVAAVTGGDEVSVLHWERGVGVTEACGSGASATAVAAHRWGLAGDTVSVLMPGGAATVAVGESVVLRGPATYVAMVEVTHG